MSHRDSLSRAAARRLAAALGLDIGQVTLRGFVLMEALDNTEGDREWTSGELLLLALDAMVTAPAAETAQILAEYEAGKSASTIMAEAEQRAKATATDDPT